MKEGRVLVIDDEPMVRETLGQVLSDEGYVVDVAVDGEVALDRVHAARPDAILLDLMMPGMNGRQFLTALRDEPAYAGVPVLIMTAVHGLEVNLAQLGASEVVEKPFNVEELLNKVALAVYRSRESRKDSQPLPTAKTNPPRLAPPKPERGVVLVVDRDRGRMQATDAALSARGYTVVSMTRPFVQLSRLARALRPRAVLLDEELDDVETVIADLRGEPELAALDIHVFARDAANSDLVDYLSADRGG
ncbi:MAG TPA: response regulator [Kofleriaceae bacterium]|jgi:DNA-binding response OmpR family regulator